MNDVTLGRVEDCPLEVLGLVRTAHPDKESTPVQAALNPKETGTIELFEHYVEGLAMRGSRRVNAIGLSLVRLLEVSGRRMIFAGAGSTP